MMKELLVKIGLRKRNWDDVPSLICQALESSDRFKDIPAVDDLALGPSLTETSLGKAIWRIPLLDGRFVSMSVNDFYRRNEEGFVVFVAARKFYSIWWALREFNNLGVCEYSEMPNDRKYPGQDAIWERSNDKPVPLAQVHYRSDCGIGFVDGITRTLWLLYNRAPSFPVHVEGASNAAALHKDVGDHRIAPQRIAEIIGSTE